MHASPRQHAPKISRPQGGVPPIPLEQSVPGPLHKPHIASHSDSVTTLHAPPRQQRPVGGVQTRSVQSNAPTMNSPPAHSHESGPKPVVHTSPRQHASPGAKGQNATVLQSVPAPFQKPQLSTSHSARVRSFAQSPSMQQLPGVPPGQTKPAHEFTPGYQVPPPHRHAEFPPIWAWVAQAPSVQHTPPNCNGQAVPPQVEPAPRQVPQKLSRHWACVTSGTHAPSTQHAPITPPPITSSISADASAMNRSRASINCASTGPVHAHDKLAASSARQFARTFSIRLIGLLLHSAALIPSHSRDTRMGAAHQQGNGNV
jgi:hypothetical protein